jgi:hypothetical protein
MTGVIIIFPVSIKGYAETSAQGWLVKSNAGRQSYRLLHTVVILWCDKAAAYCA